MELICHALPASASTGWLPACPAGTEKQFVVTGGHPVVAFKEAKEYQPVGRTMRLLSGGVAQRVRTVRPASPAALDARVPFQRFRNPATPSRNAWLP